MKALSRKGKGVHQKDERSFKAKGETSNNRKSWEHSWKLVSCKVGPKSNWKFKETWVQSPNLHYLNEGLFPSHCFPGFIAFFVNCIIHRIRYYKCRSLPSDHEYRVFITTNIFSTYKSLKDYLRIIIPRETP